MMNHTLSSTLTLIQDFAKANVILKKAGKLISMQKGDKPVDIDFSEVSRITNGQFNTKEELLQIKSLRLFISQMHDRLFERIHNLPIEDKKAAYAMVRAYAITYKSQIAHMEKEYQDCCKEFEAREHSAEEYDQLNKKLGGILAAKEDASLYFDTYTALQHYIGGLTNALKEPKK